ncbi:hypothetical protein L6452_20068 [Arctium lappa]|uniref:Uncharacterized protein n=1 Tax=Arctium lappa TaxID=4217 RepID=A0ACB9B9J2_ARCLA|nr:hypothetical protein L6452_20068 [Arctium lappa]
MVSTESCSKKKNSSLPQKLTSLALSSLSLSTGELSLTSVALSHVAIPNSFALQSSEDYLRPLCSRRPSE